MQKCFKQKGCNHHKGDIMSSSSKNKAKLKENSSLIDFDTISKEWQDDLKKLEAQLKNAIHDLTHLTVEVKIDGKNETIRKTELDLISGDIIVTLPKTTEFTETEINQINEKAIALGREELKQRTEKLKEIIETLINCFNISPTGPVSDGLKLIQTLLSK